MRKNYLIFTVLMFLEGAVTLGTFSVVSELAHIPHCPDASCPTLANLSSYTLPEPPSLYDADGRLFAHLDGETRLSVPLASMPSVLMNGYVAVEDRRFWSHGGIDLRGVARASAVDIAAGGIKEGASTITMQLARTLWMPALESMGRWRRKVSEARLAVAIERHVDKRRILELYLNSIYMGDGVYGVATASWHYFGKPLGELSLAQTATLIGMTRTPERYDPRRYPKRTVVRRNVVLELMADAGVVTRAAAASAEADSMETVPAAQEPDSRGASYYAAAVARELDEVLPPGRSRSGLRIYTAYDPVAQHVAERALKNGLAAIESGKWGRYHHPVPGAEMEPAPNGSSPYLQGAIVILDNTTGAIRAVVGGRSFRHSQFDRALQALRQPGSAFKPIVVAAALASGSASLASTVATTPVVVQTAEGDWSPRDAQAEGDSMTVRRALARSSNRAAVRIGQGAGIDHVLAMARALGLKGPLPAVPSLFLGSGDVRLVDLTGAYAAFANGGRRVTPHVIRRIEDRDGRVLVEGPVLGTPALDPRVAFLTRRAMEGVITSGTGWRARRAGYRGDAAGKTGTTTHSADAWFIGMNPVVSAGVWVGFDQPQNIVPGGSGSNLAAPVWGSMMAELFPSPWPRWPSAPPQGLVKRSVEPRTGLLSTEACPTVTERAEYFIPGTEPPSACEAAVPAVAATRTSGSSSN